jgi:hypothetical protein
MTRVVLHIDRLVLRGVPAAQRDALVASMQQNLRRLLAEPGIVTPLRGLGERDRLRSGFAGHGGPAAVGAAAAQALVREVTR